LKTSVGDFVKEDIRIGPIFRRYDIDFCCNGGVSLESACQEKGINPESLLLEIKNLEKSHGGSRDYNALKLSELINTILNDHHNYVKNTIPEISALANKVEEVHSAEYPNLSQIQYLWAEVANELLDHLVKEELALFPYILSLENAEFNNQKPEIPPFKSLVHPIAMMEGEHEFAGGTFAKISELSDRFTPPKDACGSYTLLFTRSRNLRPHPLQCLAPNSKLSCSRN